MLELDLFANMFDKLAAGLRSRLPYLISGLVVLLAFYVLGRIVRRIILAAGGKTRLDAMLARLLGAFAAVAVYFTGALLACVVVFPTFKPGDLIAGLGITSLAVGFAFKDILQNFMAGILILWRKPFRVGDQIHTKSFDGTVEEINVRSTRLRTYDGERAVLPNSDVYSAAVLVHTAYDRRRIRLDVAIRYSDSLEQAREVIHRALSETEGVLPEPAPWVYVSDFEPSAVRFTIYYWVTPLQANVLKVTDRLATRVRLALDEAGLHAPFPHRVVLLQDEKDQSV